MNDAPSTIAAIGGMPVKSANGTTVYMRDVADVTDGAPPQPNIVHVEGKRSVLLTVFKNGSASTLAIIAGIRQKAADAKASLPDNLQIDPIGDQSIFVRSAITGVAREGVIAALLTSVMILLFLGSWRSTVIIATSIPLAILGSISILTALGETLNIMTLGGLALAVGILVDDATVTIENINWHLEQGKEVEPAILDGAAQIVTPAFVSLLCICIVFVPMFFLSGVAKFLFVPMAEAVIFAMISSFILSRTLVPTMAKYLLKPHVQNQEQAHPHSPNPLVRFQRGFERGFERVRSNYSGILELLLNHRRGFVVGFFAFVALSFALVPFLGRNFFPDVDAGQILLHVRAPVGTRIETTAEIFAQVEDRVRATIPPSELGTVVDNMGLSTSSINTAVQQHGNDWPARRGRSDLAEGRPSAHCRIRSQVARRVAARVSRRHVLIPSCGHRRSDPELRLARADRPSSSRQESAGRLCLREPDAASDPAYSRHCRRSHRAIAGQSPVQYRRRPCPCAASGHHRTRDVNNSLVVHLAGVRGRSPRRTGSTRPMAWNIRLSCRRRNTRSIRCRP